MLQNFNPSFVLDLTATPKRGSNIISFVDARQLKAENMVKLPVIVYNRKSQEDVFISAVSLRRKLELEAVKGQKNGGKYIRPIVLFQAQPNNNADSTTYEKIKHTLMEMGIPESEIAIKTADRDELKNIDLSSPDCGIRYIITVNALKEGWDCPFAYILATVANRTSSIDVEQILGRILRLPNTRKNEREVLNLSYVITSSNAFYATLDKVVVGLNAAGFTSKDYRVDDCEAVVDEQQTTQEVNSQTELPLDNIQVSNDDKDTDELDRLNVELMKIQLETLEKISCLPSYKLPREISPTNTIASIPKSLYSEEENFDTEYERKVVMELSSLNNVRWWHRNIARKGFLINGAINAYPDLMVKTESGKLLLIETKGDQLENSESKEKAETGAKWAEMAGRMYKYYMVFETKNPGYNGAYSYEEFMRIVKEL